MELGYSQRAFSPYASQSVTLLLGPSSEPQARYTVPKSLLKTFPISEIIESHLPCESTLHLPDISPDIGHTLVHYLHTGHYETLCSPDSSNTTHYLLEYHRSLETYSTARTYTLPGLASLAQIHIIRLTSVLSTANILAGVRAIHPKLFHTATATEDAWFREYVASVIFTACEEDDSFLVSDVFLTSFGKRGEDVKFDRFLMRIALDVAVRVARDKGDMAAAAAAAGGGSCAFPRPGLGSQNGFANGCGQCHDSCDEGLANIQDEAGFEVCETWQESHQQQHQQHQQKQNQRQRQALEEIMEGEPRYDPVREPVNGFVLEDRLVHDIMDRPFLDDPDPVSESAYGPEEVEVYKECDGPEPEEKLVKFDLSDTPPVDTGPATESQSPSPTPGKKSKKNKKKKKKTASIQPV